MKRYLCSTAFILSVLALPVGAKQTFELHLQVTDPDYPAVGSHSYSQRKDLERDLSSAGFVSLLGSLNYGNATEISGDVVVQGVSYQIQLGELDVVSSSEAFRTLTVRSACLANSRVFVGANRDESVNLMRDWLQDGAEGLNRGCLVKGPTDPIAGNPSSLMSTMLESDFALASENSSRMPIRRAAEYRLSPSLGSYQTADYRYESYTMPVSVVLPLAEPRNRLLMSMPLTQANNNGSQSTMASVGVHLQRRMNDHWQLTPGVRMGYLDSDSYQASAMIYAASVHNTLFFYFNRFDMSLHSLLSQYRTEKNPFSSYPTVYSLENRSLKNALRIDGALNLRIFGAPGSWALVLADTQFFGDPLYMEHYQELALSVGTRRRVGSGDWQAIRMGLTYTQGEHGFSGYKINFGYFF